jgi:purine-binding chemotaxis protein CheW
MSQNLDSLRNTVSEKGAATTGVLQYLTFTVQGEEYGIDIMTVREIKGWTSVTRLPNTPEHMRGVMNLRGIIVPIFDLRARFTGKMGEATASSVIIILAVGDRNIGVLVDSVSDILNVAASEVKPAPETNDMAGAKFITGLISLDKRMVVILDIQHVFDSKDIESTAQAVA